jgi:hypothetical protein
MLNLRAAAFWLAFGLLLLPGWGMADDLADGFALGRASQASQDLAGDLYFIQSLARQFAAGKEELVGADPNNTDFALAGGALTYAIWRTKLAVIPACEDWLKDGALDSAALKDSRRELRDLLSAIQVDGAAFLAAAEQGDPQALAAWTDAIEQGSYVDKLLDLNQRLTARAGQ